MRISRISGLTRVTRAAYALAICVAVFSVVGAARSKDPPPEQPATESTQEPTPQPADQQRDLPPDPTPDFSTMEFGRVTRVLDANTVLIRIEDRTVRYDLLGVIAPGDKRERANAQQATEALTRMLLGESVSIQHDPQGRRNAANRQVAYLYRNPDHLFVNLELVRQGYTKHSPDSMTIHTAVFEFYQTRAQHLYRGIWDPQAPSEAEPDTHIDDEQDDDSEDSQQQHPADFVYITTYGTRYHTKDCPHLTDSARPASRDTVKDSHKPCKTCKPDDG